MILANIDWGTVTDLKLLFTRLVRLEIELWDALDARLKHDAGIALRDYLPMQTIATTKSCRVYHLMEQIGVTVGTASKAVDRLEAAGYCQRTDDPGDRRSPIITLTTEGIVVLAKATNSIDAELRLRFDAAATPAAIEQLAGTIDALLARGEETRHAQRRPRHHD
jgi:DNA-binding MarR family transcriptional regulator